MATIGETFEARRRRFLLACVLTVVVTGAASTRLREWTPGAHSPWWILAAILPGVVVIWWLGRKLICPSCHRELTHVATVDIRVPVKRCCRADFSQPMPSKQL
jgi:hypothetical protein